MELKKKGHPRLFYSQEDVERIRNNMLESPFKERWKIFIKNAGYISQHTAQELFDIYENYVKDIRWVSGQAGICAFAYSITGEIKYARSAVQIALALAGKSKSYWYSPEEKMYSYNKGATLITSHFSLACALVYDWCYDVLTPAEKEAIREALVNKGIAWYLASVKGSKKGFTDEGSLNLQDSERRDWWADNVISNWGGVIHGGIGVAALAIMDEEEAAQEAVKIASACIPQFVDHVVSEDGGSDEGVMYALYGITHAMYFLVSASRVIGCDRTIFEKLHEKMFGYWNIYMQGPDQRYANFNDMLEETFEGLWSGRIDMYESYEKIDWIVKNDKEKFEGGPNPCLAALFESFVPEGDSLLLWSADNGGPVCSWMGISPFYFLWRRNSAPLQGDKPELQKSVLFRGAGHLIVQSDTLWLAYNGGRISREAHCNFDLGTFVLKVKEEGFICDPGYGQREVSKHSTVMIDGLGQKLGGEAHFTKYISREAYTYFASDLTESYISNDVKKVERHFTVVGGKYILILDHIQGYDDLNIELRFQTKNLVKYVGNKAVIPGRNCSLTIISAGKQKVLTEAGDAWNGNHHEVFRYVRLNPLENQKDCIIATLLYPVESLEKLPELIYRHGAVHILHPDGNEDMIRFADIQGDIKITEINGDLVPEQSMHLERSIIPFRDFNKKGITLEEINPWVLHK